MDTGNVIQKKRARLSQTSKGDIKSMRSPYTRGTFAGLSCHDPIADLAGGSLPYFCPKFCCARMSDFVSINQEMH